MQKVIVTFGILQPSAGTLDRAMEYQTLENWPDRAAGINGDDGSFSSDVVT